MGLSGIGFSELLLILVVLLVLFGSKKLPSIASDLGSAIRDFRRAFTNAQDSAAAAPPDAPTVAGDGKSESAPRP